MKHTTKTAAAALAIFAFATGGCVQTKVQTSDGTTLSSVRFLWPGKIARAEVSTTNSLLLLQGYQSDTAELAGKIAEGTAKGLKSLK